MCRKLYVRTTIITINQNRWMTKVPQDVLTGAE